MRNLRNDSLRKMWESKLEKLDMKIQPLQAEKEFVQQQLALLDAHEEKLAGGEGRPAA